MGFPPIYKFLELESALLNINYHDAGKQKWL